jgi:hypothetical protein
VATEATIIIDNDVELDGGGNLTVDGNEDHRVFSVPDGVTAELRGSTVTRGRGGIYNKGSLTLTDATVSANQSGGVEGGIFNQGVLTLNNSTVSGNHSGGGVGGGIRNEGTATLNSSIVSDNSHGGVLNAGALVLINSTVSGNANGYYSGMVPTPAGGIHNGGGTAMLTSSTVSGNIGGVGGGISNAGGMVTVFNSTVSGNTAVQGGGIFLLDGVVTLTNSTVSGNTAAEGSGIYNDDVPGTIEIATTLLNDDCFGAMVSDGSNIESPGNTCGFDTNKGDQFDVTAEQLNLGPLQDNGGPTMTHALLPGSVAIDKIPEVDCVDADGQPLTTDQRGVARPQGPACDVGAFELEVAP